MLVPYTVNPKSLEEIQKTYKALIESKRLFIPAQVAREFAKNRARKLTEIYQQLSSKRTKVIPFQTGRYPLLENLVEYKKVLEIEKELDEKCKEYKNASAKVLDHIRGWIWDDPVSLLYGSLFLPDVIYELEISEDDVREDLKKRQQYKIPPGYKDAAKTDGGVGDVLIWHAILELGKKLKKDVIFVSGDEKPDWWHQGDGALYPRFELIDEFRRKCDGRAFHLIRFSDFLDLFDAGESVVKEVRIEETRRSADEHPYGAYGGMAILPRTIESDGVVKAQAQLKAIMDDPFSAVMVVLGEGPEISRVMEVGVARKALSPLRRSLVWSPDTGVLTPQQMHDYSPNGEVAAFIDLDKKVETRLSLGRAQVPFYIEQAFTAAGG